MNSNPPTTVTELLHELNGATEDQQWNVERLVTGGQAEIFLARRVDGAPCGEMPLELIVKLFHPFKPEVHQAVHDEFASLQELQAAVDQIAVGDWTIRTPQPLLVACNSTSRQSPLGLVMTRVPGTPLATLLRRSDWLDDLTCETTIEAIVEAIVTVLERYWTETGRVYGDMNFRNILCDPSTKTLSFVDCGIPEQSWLCDDVRKLWYPASRDLAYLLFSTAAEWRRSFGNPEARQRELRLAQATLAEFIRRIDSISRQESALEEIMSCADEHLSRLPRSWTPQGVWRSFVKLKAEQCMDEVFANLQYKLNAHVEDVVDCSLGLQTRDSLAIRVKPSR